MTQTEINRRDVPDISRRYDLDWLRILAFAVLILYHVGMYYVAEWDWHIKSSVTSVALQDWMIPGTSADRTSVSIPSATTASMVNPSLPRTRTPSTPSRSLSACITSLTVAMAAN